MRLKDEPLEIVDEVKLLGVIINKDLKWSKNTNYLVKKANKKMRMLHIASKFTRNREHLKQIYKTFIRCNLEFSSNVWHSSLTKENREDLERVQKAALKVILKEDYSNYEDALKQTNLESVHERSETIALRFAKNCLNSENFLKLFPLNNQNHRIRKQSPRSCDPCCVAEANEDMMLIITPPISRSDILLTSDTLEQSSHIVSHQK